MAHAPNTSTQETEAGGLIENASPGWVVVRGNKLAR